MDIVATWTDIECAALRHAYQMNQTKFAQALGAAERSVRGWEKGQRPVGYTAQGLYAGMLAKAPAEVKARFHVLRKPEDEEHERRELSRVGTAIGAAALASLGVGDTVERANYLMSGAGRPDSAAVDLMRSTLHQAMQLDDLLGSPAAQGMVVAQQQVTEAMLRDTPATLRPMLLSLYAEWTGLAGSLAWDVRDYATSGRLYTQAREFAHEAEDSDLAAYMLCHLSQLATWQKRPRIAVDYAVAARSWVAQSADRHLRAYVAVRNAEAAAIAGQHSVCLESLDDADAALVGLQPVHPSQSRAYFMGAAIQESYRGNCLSVLGRAEAAAQASRSALALMQPEYVRDRAVTLLELEGALIQMGSIEEAATAVADAAELAEQNRSPRLAGAIADGRHRLAPWASTRVVRELDEQLASRDIVTP
ncbi:hypothetical protein B7C42_08213 [Nocardia cerradoensis]|uniref:HTH cro/C1-type domain-containing protein n=2 Tax=Nocardia cerradoensis TaxID=85688 RepID=A0A231GTA7_9NOCA|nr:hypothetical protein B7C42_08213 [Nocardia cerradoensis]